MTTTLRLTGSQVALAQGVYFAATGVLPFLSRRAFAALTGPKKEWWLVETVGGLVGVLGGALIAAGLRGSVPRELKNVALGSAAVLAAIDVVYVAKDRISPVYLIDAMLEAGIIAAWTMAEPAAPPVEE